MSDKGCQEIQEEPEIIFPARVRENLVRLMLVPQELLGETMSSDELEKMANELGAIATVLEAKTNPLLSDETIKRVRDSFRHLASDTADLVTADNRTPVIKALGSTFEASKNHIKLAEEIFQEIPDMPRELDGATVIGARQLQRNFRTVLNTIKAGGVFLVRKDKKPQAVLRPQESSSVGQIINPSECQHNPSHYCNRALAGESFILEREGVMIVPPPRSAFCPPSHTITLLSRRVSRKKQ